MYSTDAERLVRSTLECSLLFMRKTYVLLCPMADGNVFSSLCFQRFLSFHSKTIFVMYPLAVMSHKRPRVAYPYAFSQYGHARSRRRASARRVEAPLLYNIKISKCQTRIALHPLASPYLFCACRYFLSRKIDIYSQRKVEKKNV